jgi:hypothetical protein
VNHASQTATKSDSQAKLSLCDETSCTHWIYLDDLLGPIACHGTAEWMSNMRGIDAPEGGVAVTPSISGIELFLWAHGRGDLVHDSFLSGDLVLEPVEDLGRVEDAEVVQSMQLARAARMAREQQQATE